MFIKSFCKAMSNSQNPIQVMLLLALILFIGCGIIGLKGKIYKSTQKIEKIVKQVNDRVVEQEMGELGQSLYEDYLRDMRDRIKSMEASIESRINQLPVLQQEEMNDYYKKQFDALYIRLNAQYPQAMEQLQLE